MTNDMILEELHEGHVMMHQIDARVDESVDPVLTNRILFQENMRHLSHTSKDIYSFLRKEKKRISSSTISQQV